MTVISSVQPTNRVVFQESGKFCGVARLATESRRDGAKVSWILPPGLSAKALGGVFKIDWICTGDLSFNKVSEAALLCLS